VTPPTFRQYSAFIFLGIVLVFAATVAIDDFAGIGQPPDFVEAVISGGLLAGWGTLLWRDFWTGLYASHSALRIRSLFRTRTVPWSGISRIEARPARLLGWDLAQDAIWIVLTTDTDVQTPIQRWDRGATFQPQTGVTLQTKQFDRTVQELRSYRRCPNTRRKLDFRRSQ
ncbi:MAG: PH domain-containing protein, partial [Actinocatenispora sp.]